MLRSITISQRIDVCRRDSYKETLSSTRRLVADSPSTAAASIADVLAPYELPQHLTEDLTFHLAKSPHLLPFLMTFQHNAAEQASSRAITCALTIATGSSSVAFCRFSRTSSLQRTRSSSRFGGRLV